MCRVSDQSLLFKAQLLVSSDIYFKSDFSLHTFKTKLKCVTLFLKGLFCFCNENCLHKAKSLVLDTRGHIFLMRGSFCFFWNGGVFFCTTSKKNENSNCPVFSKECNKQKMYMKLSLIAGP